MGNPYAQVALIYVRRSLSAKNAFMGLAFISVTFACCIGHEIPLPIWFFLVFWITHVFAGLALHIRQQFANSRSHLMPGFRPVHATVAAVAILIVATVVPATVAWLTDMRSVGLVAVALTLFGAISGLCCSRRSG